LQGSIGFNAKSTAGLPQAGVTMKVVAILSIAGVFIEGKSELQSSLTAAPGAD
jgi:hypothetical protein